MVLYDNVGHLLVLHSGLIQYIYIHHSSCILLYTSRLSNVVPYSHLNSKNRTYYTNASDVPRSSQSWVSTIHGFTHSWRFSTFYKTNNHYTFIRNGQNNRRQLALSSAIPQGKHNQPCMVYGLVLQVRAYCAQYNIRKTTNSSTIGALLIVLPVNGTWKRELFSTTVKRLKIGSWRVVRSLIQLLMVMEIFLLTMAASGGVTDLYPSY